MRPYPTNSILPDAPRCGSHRVSPLSGGVRDESYKGLREERGAYGAMRLFGFFKRKSARRTRLRSLRAFAMTRGGQTGKVDCTTWI